MGKKKAVKETDRQTESECPWLYEDGCPHSDNPTGCPYVDLIKSDSIKVPGHCKVAR